MVERLLSLDRIAAEVRLERDAHVRHLDAVDTKAGIILGFSGAVAAIGSRKGSPATAPGLVLAVAAGLTALSGLVPRTHPAWDLARLRGYLPADAELTELKILDTGIVVVRALKLELSRKTRRLRIAMSLLALAVFAAAAGSLVH